MIWGDRCVSKSSRTPLTLLQLRGCVVYDFSLIRSSHTEHLMDNTISPDGIAPQ